MHCLLILPFSISFFSFLFFLYPVEWTENLFGLQAVWWEIALPNQARDVDGPYLKTATVSQRQIPLLHVHHVVAVERTEMNGEAKRLKRAIDFVLHIIYY